MQINYMFEVKNLSFHAYKNVYFTDISLNIYPGEIIGLLGKNGAGKSTLLKKLCGFGKNDLGKIYFQSQDIHKNLVKYRKNISGLLDNINFYPHLSGEENLSLHSINSKNAFTLWMIKKFDMQTNIKKKVSDYSLGMLQKLRLIYALSNKKKLIFLDEPTNGLDFVAQKAFIEIVKLLRKRKCSIIISSHHIQELKDYCTSMVLLNNGQLINIDDQNFDFYEIKILDSCKLQKKNQSYTIFPKDIIFEKDYSYIKVNDLTTLNSTLSILVKENITIEEIVKIDNFDNLIHYFSNSHREDKYEE